MTRDTFARRVRLLAALVVSSWCSTLALPQTIPSGGESLVGVADIATGGGFYSNTTSGGTVAARTIVAVSGQPFAQAAEIDVMNPTSQFWDSAVSASSTRALAKDDVVLLHFYMRAIETTDETGSVFAQVYAEGPGPNYTKSVSQNVSAGPAWMEFFIPFQVAEAVSSGQFGVKFGFGSAPRPQVLQIAGAEAIWYGTSRTLAEMPRTSIQYEGRAADAAWRSDAARRIEQYRKADYTIRVVNNAGLPVPDADVHVRLRRHAFQFGSAWVASRVVDQSTTDNQNYRAKLLELFNAGSPENDLKWGPWIGDWGAGFSRTQTLNALTWLKDTAQFHLRGHVLVWPSTRNTPTSIASLITAHDPSLPQVVLDHIAEEVSATADLVPEWDVLNEPYDNHDIMDIYGRSLMADWFAEAALHNPTAELFINDYGILSGGGLNVAKHDAYIATIHEILDDGGPLTGVGFQGHFDGSPTGISKVWSILQRFSTEFPDLKFKVTEYDVDSDDEELQADYLRDLLTLVFSHPQFTGFQLWGFWEGAHWKPRAAMIRSNWEEKPAAAAWRSLVLDQWQTDETRTTGSDGRVRGRGFLGDYDITVSVGGTTVPVTSVIDADGLVQEVTVDVPLDGTPRVTHELIGTTVTPGAEAVLQFEAAGAPAPTITWFKNGVAIGGAGDPALTIASAAGSDEATYYAEITNGLGTVRTRSVKLGVRAPEDRTEKLVNISTRGRVMGGDAIMIAGFVIEGGSKDVLLRAVGPRLGIYGVTGPLADPAITLYRSSDNSVVTSNQNWDPALAPVFAQVGAFPLTDDDPDVPDDTTSAALRQTLAAGVYTVHMTSEDGSTGVGLVEAYDVALGEPLKLVNISTRGFVGTGDDVLIAGFVVRGQVPQRVLIRGIGPQLARFGVSDTLTDPRLTLFEPAGQGSRVIATNDDWCAGNDRATLEAAAAQVGAYALEPYSPDACLVLSLEPGTYTVHLSGAPGLTGVGMVEVYAMP